jgi:hypothetical protein
MNVTELTKRAAMAPCAACEIRAVLSDLWRAGAVSKVGKLRKSPAIRAVCVHTCDKNDAGV